MRPMTGTETVRLSMMCDGGGDKFIFGGPEPSMTLGWNPPRFWATAGSFSGSLMTSMARARWAKR